ncbi:MAG TPA: hypothetical protein VMT18_12700 [Planctomycetota bacterium]|nr:hypothetical protein [Planctomycetota bacterium]
MRDEVRHCPACEDTTAHQRRGGPWPTLLGGALFAVGALASIGGGLSVWPASLPFALLGVWLVQHDRRQRWDIACGRCRAKAVAQGRWAWLRTTEVHLM